VTAIVRGLYAVTPDMMDTETLVRRVTAALEGGAALVQYRNKSAPESLKREQAARLQVVCTHYGVPLVVNDSPALAAAVGARGLHLGRDDGPVAEARRHVGVDTLIGVSCYDSLERAQTAVANGADYVAFGAAYPSKVKPNAVRADRALFVEARRRYRVPIVAIGGITLDNAAALLACGVDAVAVISAVFDAPDITDAARSFNALFSRSV
jgi:thiamine-phosphate pyrophosphorylase